MDAWKQELYQNIIHTQDNNFIAHYGVLGMKWGRRKVYVKQNNRQKKFKVVTDKNKQIKSSKEISNKTAKNKIKTYLKKHPKAKKAVGAALITATIAAAGYISYKKFGEKYPKRNARYKKMISRSLKISKKMSKSGIKMMKKSKKNFKRTAKMGRALVKATHKSMNAITRY